MEKLELGKIYQIGKYDNVEIMTQYDNKYFMCHNNNVYKDIFTQFNIEEKEIYDLLGYKHSGIFPPCNSLEDLQKVYEYIMSKDPSNKKTINVEDLKYPHVIHITNKRQWDCISKSKSLSPYTSFNTYYLIGAGSSSTSYIGNSVGSGPYINYEFEGIIFPEGHIDKEIIKKEKYYIGQSISELNIPNKCFKVYNKANKSLDTAGYNLYIDYNDSKITELRDGYFAIGDWCYKWFKISEIENAQPTTGKESSSIEQNELTSLPEKWCVKPRTSKEADEIFTYKGISEYSDSISLKYYQHYPTFKGCCTASSIIQEGYTEITYEQFKKWVMIEKPLNKTNFIHGEYYSEREGREGFPRVFVYDKPDHQLHYMNPLVTAYFKNNWDSGVEQNAVPANTEEIAWLNNCISNGKYVSKSCLPLVKEETDMEEILRQAKEKYPIGCKYRPILGNGSLSPNEHTQTKECYIYESGREKWIIGSHNIRNAKGQWAELVSLPEIAISVEIKIEKETINSSTTVEHSTKGTLPLYNVKKRLVLN